MTNRLPYETIGGNVDESATYGQLAEHLRLASEACMVLGHLKKANDAQRLSAPLVGRSQQRRSDGLVSRLLRGVLG